MGKIIFSYGKYGVDKSKEPKQSLWLRIFHNNLNYAKSLKMDISKEGFDFKTNHIIDLLKGSVPKGELKKLQSVKKELKKIESTFDDRFFELKLSRRLKSFNNQQWREWCDDVVLEGRGGAIADRILLKDKMIECKGFLKSKGGKESTLKGWDSRIKMLESFEKDINHKYYTDELDLKFWGDSMNWVLRNGRKRSYHGEFIKKIKATYHHFSPLNSDTTEWNTELSHKEFRITKSEPRDDNYIKIEDWERIIAYEGKGYLNNMRDLAIIQYNACLRYSELHQELKYYEKNGKFKNMTKNSGGTNIWTIKEIKKSNDEKIKVKTFPVHNSIVRMIENNRLPHIISNAQMNKQIKDLAKEVGIEYSQRITTHTIRHSKITHLVSLEVPTRLIKMLSGHQSDSSFQGYDHDKVDLKNHPLPMD